MADDLLDVVNRHESYIQRLATHLRNEYPDKSLMEAYRVVRLILLDVGDIKTPAQLSKVIEKMDSEVKRIMNSSWGSLTEELENFGGNEAVFYANMFGVASAVTLSVPAQEKITSYINKSLMSLDKNDPKQTGTWAKYVKINTDSVNDVYNEVIKDGYRNGLTVQQMVNQLRNKTNGVLRTRAESLVRTGTAHYAVQSRRAMADDNKDVLKTEIPHIVYDNRVTVICISIDAKYNEGWPLNKSPIGYPPYHFRCRTVIIYLPKGQKEIGGTRSSVSGKKSKEAEDNFNKRKARFDKRRNDPDNKKSTPSQVRRKGNKDKAFKGSQIDNATPFSKFLMSQPDWYIYDTLKPKVLADSFLAGDLDLATLTDKNLSPLSTKEVFKRN